MFERDQVSRGVSVPCRNVTLVANVQMKLSEIGKKVSFGYMLDNSVIS